MYTGSPKDLPIDPCGLAFAPNHTAIYKDGRRHHVPGVYSPTEIQNFRECENLIAATKHFRSFSTLCNANIPIEQKFLDELASMIASAAGNFVDVPETVMYSVMSIAMRVWTSLETAHAVTTGTDLLFQQIEPITKLSTIVGLGIPPKTQRIYTFTTTGFTLHPGFLLILTPPGTLTLDPTELDGRSKAHRLARVSITRQLYELKALRYHACYRADAPLVKTLKDAYDEELGMGKQSKKRGMKVYADVAYFGLVTDGGRWEVCRFVSLQDVRWSWGISMEAGEDEGEVKEVWERADGGGVSELVRLVAGVMGAVADTEREDEKAKHDASIIRKG